MYICTGNSANITIKHYFMGKILSFTDLVTGEVALCLNRYEQIALEHLLESYLERPLKHGKKDSFIKRLVSVLEKLNPNHELLKLWK